MKRTLLFATVIATAWFVSAAFGETGNELLQKALVKERSEGNLKEAIKLYQQVVDKYGKDRALAAKALVAIGESQEKLGEAEARKTYERIVREYGDQKDALATARARLADNGATHATGIIARQIWAHDGVAEALMAPDGRTLSMGGLMLRDISTGKTTNLMPNPNPSGGFAEWPVLSADSRNVAYAWSSPEDGNYQVRVAAAEPGAKPRILLRNPEFVYYFLWSWSPDGKSVLSIIHVRGNTTQLAWISAADGSVKALKSLEWRSPGLANLSPDGKFIAYDVLVRQDSPDREIRVLAADGSRENVLIKAPGINGTPVWTRDGAHIFFTSNRSGSVGLYSIAVRDGRAAGPVELAKANTGAINPLGFTHTGSFLYLQSVGHQDVFTVPIDKASGKAVGNPERLVDTFVGANLNPAWSPDGKAIAYISRRSGPADQTSPGTLVIRSLESGQETTIPGTFIYGSQPMWFPDGQGILQSGRNSQNNTCFYKVDLRTNEVRELINMGAGAPPAMALSRDGKVVYAAPLDQKPGIVAAYDLASGRRTDIYAAADPIRALAASPDGSKIAFVAETRTGGPPMPSHLYVANRDGSDAHDLLAGQPQNAFLNALAWAPDGRSIYFVRSDSPSVGSPHESQLWRVSANGGSPEYSGLSAKNIGTIDVSRDSARLIFGGGELSQTEYWMLDGLGAVRKSSGK